jgi:hypothetical protein
MKVPTLFLLMAVLLLAAPVPAAEADRLPERTLLVHVKTQLDGGTDRTQLVPRLVAEALAKGTKVVLLFDAEGVLSLKVGRWFGGHSTPLDRVKITPRERQHLAGLLGTTPSRHLRQPAPFLQGQGRGGVCQQAGAAAAQDR